MVNPIILIPAYEPVARISDIIDELLLLDVSLVLIVDDGSGETYRRVFDELAARERVEVLHHERNQGKGAALRTGFRHILEKHPDASGVLTADGDGQHLAGDVEKVARSMRRHPRSLILGSRSFRGKEPFRSRFGNSCTRMLYASMTGQRLTDTQTGLRGIPAHLLPTLTELNSSRFEYELDMLLTLREKKISVVEESIETVYEDNNEGSHFRPVADSVRIYTLLFSWFVRVRLAGIFKYSLTSMMSTAVDFIVYGALIYLASASIAGASTTARILAVFTHFMGNKYFTFSHRNAPNVGEILKYLGVALLNLVFSILLIEFFVGAFGLEKVLSKVIAQSLLFLFTYFLLSRFVFLIRGKKAEKSD